MKKTLSIIGLGVAAGAVAYLLWSKNKKQENISAKEYDSSQNVDFINTDIAELENQVGIVKSTVALNITERHEDAAQIMKDAVDIIYKQSDTSEETEKLERISDELDNLLSEE